MTDLSRIIGQRLRKCRDERGWTLEESVRRLGQYMDSPIGTTSMSMWELGERRPKMEAFVSLSKLYGVPAYYLAGLDEGQHAGDYIYPQTAPNVPGLLCDSAIADDALSFRAGFLRELSIRPENLMLVRMPDDSMSGEVNKGDRVLLDLSKREVIQRDLFALLVNGRVWVRWIRPEIDETFTIASAAPDQYPDQKVTADELQKFQIIGRVVLTVKRR